MSRSSSSGASSWNDETQISDTCLFTDTADTTATLTFSGLASQTAGSRLRLTVWGIGDNHGQQTSFTATYGAAKFTQATAYNGGGDRTDSTGSVTSVQFDFVADGTTDLMTVVLAKTAIGAAGRFSNINTFSLSGVSTAVPEPGSLALLGLIGDAMSMRRRRK